MRKFAKMAVAAAIAGMAGASQAALVIDDFSVDTLLIQDGDKGDAKGRFISTDTLDGTKILGKQRDVYVEKIGYDGAGTDSTARKSGVEVDGGSLIVSNDNGVRSRTILKYDGSLTGTGETVEAMGNVGDAPASNTFLSTLDLVNGLGHVDLTQFGDAFALSVFSSNANFEFAITVYTSATKYSTLLVTAKAHIAGDPIVPEPIHFASFTPPPVPFPSNFLVCTGIVPPNSPPCLEIGSDGAADFTDVQAIVTTVNYRGVKGVVDFEILDANVVPEPGSLALVGVGLLGLGAIRRRKSA